MATIPFALAKDQATIEAPVTRVVDGDTFKLQGQTRSIRIWGLDAPERDIAGGPAATAALRQLISGETLRCLIHDTDRYRRFVGQCFRPGALLQNSVSEGFTSRIHAVRRGA